MDEYYFDDPQNVRDELLRMANLTNELADLIVTLTDMVKTLEKRVAELERGR